MLPDLATLIAGYALYAKRNGTAPLCNRDRLSEALHEAEALSRDNASDEPAALFFALSRRPRTFGANHGRMTLHLAVQHAQALGFALTVDVAVLELMRARIVRGAIDFEALRRWFSDHLVKVPPRAWPPG